ncbi:MAG: bifunctional (p)ppGpp synthetase/guanosine-3',5'-bis(diphosphate) 3'-pyrophosphohydrolase, partial [Prevotella sp.]|nr:bifunctional (p)ppGpp synthetase/guanosine-3',5'-bis(diphosphate) 3'-pyrophosphohydrolase [Prevotella sp.]
QWIEVQIRSNRMNEIAENGFAAHWKYKEGEYVTEDEGELNDWLLTIKEILDDPQPDAMDFLDAIKLNLFASEIFVFTPKGEIKTMPAGCTALDFAFQIHTFLGSHCIGAKVNHKLVPISYKLQSGDQVEILTSNSQHVQASWVNFVSTAKARGKIQAILRRENREIQKRGEMVLQEFLKQHDMEMSSSVLDRLCDLHDIKKHELLFQALGEKKVTLNDKDLDELHGKNKSKNKGWKRLIPFIGKDKAKAAEQVMKQQGYFIVPKDFNRKKPIFITENNISQFIFTRCCHPIPGDDALGYIDNKNRIEIHKRNCDVANKLKSSYGNRIIDVKWDMHKQMFFDATITIRGIDRIGLLNEVTQVISQQLNVNIHRVMINCDDDIFDAKIELRVHDREDVGVIVKGLKAIVGLQEIQQII